MIAGSRAVSMYCWKLLILPSLTFQTWQTWLRLSDQALLVTKLSHLVGCACRFGLHGVVDDLASNEEAQHLVSSRK